MEEFHHELLESESGEGSIEHSINLAKKSSTNLKNEIEDLKTNIEEEVSYFKDFYVQVHGQEDDKGKIVGGLESEIQQRQDELNAFKKQQTSKYNALNEQIESLLPGATSAGLASAYYELKKDCLDPIRNFTILFFISLALIVLGSIVLMTESFVLYPLEWKLLSNTEWNDIAINMLRRSPLIIPLVWLAIFSAQRRSENQRLYAEYAHKEAIAKSYQGFKNQIKELHDSDSDMLKSLIKQAMEAYSFNPSSTFDKKHKTSSPTSELKDIVNAEVKRATQR
ncbi:hypothetical protein [Vibrio breoganii]|uniref:hypothetical protein n=1 Tax=Vibrio breoganii TaxID=553239 RepID=UPI000C83622C|nr:hypothetical protein [Vibrio breoganii]PML16994.1 hypothetical protein BCT84_20465 [Vibrio breoganii]